MATTAELVADRVTAKGDRFITLKLRYPYYLHIDVAARPELNLTPPATTNSTESAIADAVRDPAIPTHWITVGQHETLEVPAFMDATEPGGELLTLSELAAFRGDTRLTIVAKPLSTSSYFDSLARAEEFAWLEARDLAIVMARRLQRAGYDEVAARLLAPFAHVEVVATATDWNIFMRWASQAAEGSEIANLGRSVAFELNKTLPPQSSNDG